MPAARDEIERTVSGAMSRGSPVVLWVRIHGETLSIIGIPRALGRWERGQRFVTLECADGVVESIAFDAIVAVDDAR